MKIHRAAAHCGLTVRFSAAFACGTQPHVGTPGESPPRPAFALPAAGVSHRVTGRQGASPEVPGPSAFSGCAALVPSAISRTVPLRRLAVMFTALVPAVFRMRPASPDLCWPKVRFLPVAMLFEASAAAAE